MRNFNFGLYCILILSSMLFAKIEIINVHGDVRVRKGMDEHWQPAGIGMQLEDIDTILALEGWIELKTFEGQTFKLGSRSMIDVSDLRLITKRELFLFLMSEKVNKLPQRSEKSQLLLGNVSIVHGENRAVEKHAATMISLVNWEHEFNAAKALYEQAFYPNSVMKLASILKKYGQPGECGNIQFYLGKNFEQMAEIGQAIDAYRQSLQRSQECGLEGEYIAEIQKSIEKLESEDF